MGARRPDPGAPSARSSRALAYGQLLRISLFPSALADAVAGLVLGAGFFPSGPWPWRMILASLCVYHGGMALNDVADRTRDAVQRPERVLPSGRVSLRAALGVALLLLVAAPSSLLTGGALSQGPRFVLLGVATLAVAYDLGLRGPWLGPLLLGLCRAGNLGAAILLGWNLTAGAAGAGHSPGAIPALPLTRLLVPIAYGAYVFGVSRLGRLEDGEDDLGQRWLAPDRLLRLLALLLLVPPLLPGRAFPTPPDGPTRFAVAILLLLAVLPLLHAARSSRAPSQALLRRWMGLSLGRLVLFTAAVALLAGGSTHPGAGLLLLCAFPLGGRLARHFPPS